MYEVNGMRATEGQKQNRFKESIFNGQSLSDNLKDEMCKLILMVLKEEGVPNE